MGTNQLTAWKFLKPGDTVDVVAPGFRCSDEELEKAVEFLKSWDLKPRVPKSIFGNDFLCAQKDDLRLEQLRKALIKSDSQAVWCVRGGYGAIRILKQLYKVKKPKQPKLFLGYSDATTIHNFLHQKWGWHSLHSPLLERMGGLDDSAEDKQLLKKIVFGEQEEVSFDSIRPMNVAAKALRQLKAPIVGGNLRVLEGETGTPFQLEAKGKILFFEEVGERAYRIDRMLVHLELAGFFTGVRAILFGQFIGGDDPDGENHVQEVLDRFARAQKIPCLQGLEVGHGNPQLTLPLNSSAVLKQKSLTVSSGGEF